MFKQIVSDADALVLVSMHFDSVETMSYSEAVSANAAIPAEVMAECAFWRVWCLVELDAALRGKKPVHSLPFVRAHCLTCPGQVVMLVGDIDKDEEFVPEYGMLSNLHYLVTITKATASNPVDCKRELSTLSVLSLSTSI